MKPADFDASKKYPLMLEIHGGPHSMYNVGLHVRPPGARGERLRPALHQPARLDGLRERFGNAIKNAYPGKDFDDLMTGVDSVINRGYVDTKRMYVFGCSGGGVLTAWIVGHTDRFAAASSNCPVIELDELRRARPTRPAGTATSPSRSGRIRASTCAVRRSCTWAT